jgi:hypothetical protein
VTKILVDQREVREDYTSGQDKYDLKLRENIKKEVFI